VIHRGIEIPLPVFLFGWLCWLGLVGLVLGVLFCLGELVFVAFAVGAVVH